jgi:hypothetical protein
MVMALLLYTVVSTVICSGTPCREMGTPTVGTSYVKFPPAEPAYL